MQAIAWAVFLFFLCFCGAAMRQLWVEFMAMGAR